MKELKIDLKEYNIEDTAMFFNDNTTLYVPKKAEYNLRKYVSKKELKKIDKNLNLAIEKCLVFLSNLHLTFYTENKWKILNSEILHEQVKKRNSNNYVYSKVVDVLLKGTSKTGAIIERDDSYSVGITSKSYKLTDTYLKAGLTVYRLKEKELVTVIRGMFFRRLTKLKSNVITNNLVHNYAQVQLPTEEELLEEGKRLIKLGYKTKKGKILTMKYRKNVSYWKDSSNRSFVEDNIKLFLYLTENGLMIPMVGGEKSGGRVVDSFTLMPSWIREMVEYDYKKTVEADYTALHPNICINLYGGKTPYISHQAVADYLGVDKQVAKVEHLSFFNKTYNGMVKSPLFNYYMDHEPDMMERVVKDKASTRQGHKITSRKLFRKEVALMTEVISRLNSIDIYVGYIYDALITTEKLLPMVTDVMNEVADEMDIKTKVK